MAIKYKVDIVEQLKAKGYSTYRIRKDRLLSESTIQKFREGNTSVSLDNIATVCRLLHCQPSDLIEYEET